MRFDQRAACGFFLAAQRHYGSAPIGLHSEDSVFFENCSENCHRHSHRTKQNMSDEEYAPRAFVYLPASVAQNTHLSHPPEGKGRLRTRNDSGSLHERPRAGREGCEEASPAASEAS